MKIYGLGTDIVNVNRIKVIIKKNKNFKKRIFTLKEINFCKYKKNQFLCLSKRFSAKEAFSKALGVGISKGFKFKEIEVINDNKGKPSINIRGKSLKIVNKLLKKDYSSFLSLSDEKSYAIATVIISK